MKISVIMIDGSFRENIYGAKYFSEQDFPEGDYEVIWVEFFSKAHSEVYNQKKVKVITLNKKGTYHSSYCFNRGIKEAKGEIIVIPDADQIVKPDFLKRVWKIHNEYEKLVVYGYRYDEIEKGILNSFNFDELEKKTVLKNPTNYGGCLTVRKKWLIEINGYEEHPLFASGNHANGLDIYTRFKNLGLAIMWSPELKLYHPWHPFTLMYTKEQELQKRIIEWRRRTLSYFAIRGINPRKNLKISFELEAIIENAFKELKEENKKKFIEKKFYRFYNDALRYKVEGNKRWKSKLEEAIAVLTESKISDAVFDYRVASLYKMLGNLETSKKIFKGLLKKRISKKLLAGVFFHLGEINFLEGNLEKSKNFLQKTISLEPSYKKANEYLKKINKGESFK